jgi:hypothetical protein
MRVVGMRDGDTALDDLLRAVWATSEGTMPQVVRGGTPRGRSDQFLCLPRFERCRLLVPVRTREAQAVTTANLPLRRPRQRLGRSVLAALLATSASRLVFGRNSISIEVDDRQTPSLLSALRMGWRRDVAGIGLSVRATTPNYKPSLVAVDASGTVIGYAKVGWNDVTRTRLCREAAAMTKMGKREGHDLRVPDVEAELTWNDRYVLVVRPLPRAARPYPRKASAPLALVRSALADPQRSDIDVRTLADRLSASIDESAPGPLADTARTFAERVGRRYEGCRLTGGIRHGDWVPWNLGTARAQLWAWDWEYAEEDSTPLLDVAHWHLQVARFVEHLTVEEAFAALDSRLGPDLARLRLHQDTSGAVRDLAALELTERQAVLAAGTGIWREGIRSSLRSLLSR